MRTPLGTCLFFLAQILTMLKYIQLDPTVRRYLNLVMNQLNFMLSFVDDLLDYKQLKDGVFSLSATAFNPKEVIELIHDIF